MKRKELSEKEMDSFHGKGHPNLIVTYSGTRKLISNLTSEIEAVSSKIGSISNRKAVNLIPEIAENKKKMDGAGKC